VLGRKKGRKFAATHNIGRVSANSSEATDDISAFCGLPAVSGFAFETNSKATERDRRATRANIGGAKLSAETG
jgi:hypothetical protein